MIGGLRVGADIVEDLLVTLHIGSGIDLGAAKPIHGFGFHDAARRAYSGHQRVAVEVGGQKVEADIRCDHGIGIVDVDGSLALRAKLTHGDGHAGFGGQFAFLDVFDSEGNEVQLHVRCFQLRPGAQEREYRRGW